MQTGGTLLTALTIALLGSSCGSSGVGTDVDLDEGSRGDARTDEDRDVIAFVDSEPLLTRSDLLAELEAMPPSLRRRFASDVGQRELVDAQIDKRLLAAAARRRGLATREDIRSQVLALEERLIVKALLEQEEQALEAPADDDLRTHYDEIRHSLPRRDDGRVPSFEEAREEVLARMDARRRRQVFDALVERLRAEVDVKVNEQVLH